MGNDELDTGLSSSGPPGAKLRNIGDYLNFAVVAIDPEVPVKNYTTGEPELRADGTPKLAIRLTVMAIDGNAVRVDNDTDVAIQPGETCAIYIGSYSKYDPDNDTADAQHVSWSKAIDRLEKGGAKFKIGTVGQWAYLRDIPSAKSGNNPRKDRKFALRPAAEGEADQTTRCKELAADLKAAPAPELPNGAPAPQAPAPTLANF